MSTIKNQSLKILWRKKIKKVERLSITQMKVIVTVTCQNFEFLNTKCLDEDFYEIMTKETIKLVLYCYCCNGAVWMLLLRSLSPQGAIDAIKHVCTN